MISNDIKFMVYLKLLSTA